MKLKDGLLVALFSTIFGYCFIYETLMVFGLVPGYSSLPASVEPAIPVAPWAFLIGWLIVGVLVVLGVQRLLFSGDEE